MTLQEFQDLIHTLYQGDTETPDEADADWATRLLILEGTIRAWDSEKGILWDELWALNDTEQESSQTTDGSTTAFDCTDNFRKPGGYVRLINSSGDTVFYSVKKPHEVEIYRNTSEKIAYFTGNKNDGFVLNFLVAPATGYTIEYPFYKDPTIPSATTDKIEMSNPMFAVELSLSKLHELDGEGDRAELALSKAQAILLSMRTSNVMEAWHQSSAPKDEDSGSGGFGV